MLNWKKKQEQTPKNVFFHALANVHDHIHSLLLLQRMPKFYFFFNILMKCFHNSSPVRQKGTQNCSHTLSSLTILLFSDSFHFIREIFPHGNDLCVQGEASLLKKIIAIYQRKPQRKQLVGQKNRVCPSSTFILFLFPVSF